MVLGALGSIPVIVFLAGLWAEFFPEAAGLLGLPGLRIDKAPPGAGGPSLIDPLLPLLSGVVAPTLFLWGLMRLPRSGEARRRVTAWAFAAFCLATPLFVGLVLAVPLILLVLLPAIAGFRREVLPPHRP
ncbi:hypothetical protein [Falsiroseomonas ponticola]|uniref:hypothetical protein n=1 Tax=Falsiroseomonas ponticola TaxID=2786951 RepID=UPI001932A820|nr:hypothetical protein [Roseomonas ponticola]